VNWNARLLSERGQARTGDGRRIGGAGDIAPPACRRDSGTAWMTQSDHSWNDRGTLPRVTESGQSDVARTTAGRHRLLADAAPGTGCHEFSRHLELV